jgi:hypothetical protein
MARSWKAAPAVLTLLKQVNELAPKRSKSADGIIGDASHAARSSDHNPNGSGIVCAIDITAVTTQAFGGHLAEAMRHDGRVHYVIWNRRIATDGGSWRGYSGTSPHTDHVHISIHQDAHDWNDTRPFNLAPYFSGAPVPKDWWLVSFRTKRTGNAALVLKYATVTRGCKAMSATRPDGSVAAIIHAGGKSATLIASYALVRGIVCKVQRTALDNSDANLARILATE